MNYALSLWAGVAVLGFAMVFSVPRRTLPGIFALAALAHLVRAIVMDVAGASLPVASFVAALMVGTTAAIVAPRTDQATPIYAIAPVIPLIPGTYIFTALRAVIDMTELTSASPEVTNVIDTALTGGATAMLTVIALSVGTIAPGLLIGRHLAKLGEVITMSPPLHSHGHNGTEDDALL